MSTEALTELPSQRPHSGGSTLGADCSPNCPSSNSTDTQSGCNTKQCRGCGETQPIDQFTFTSDGYRRHFCRACRTKNRKRWEAENRKKLTDSKREWYRKNSEQQRAYAKARRLAHPEKFADYRRRRGTGIALGEYDKLLAAQGGKCAVCGREPPVQKRPLGVDHCHATGKIRGLLCNCCNTAIGSCQDDPEVLRSAAAYLERYRETTTSS